MQRVPRQPYAQFHCLRPFSFLFLSFVCFFGDTLSLFTSTFVPLLVSFYLINSMESTSYVFPSGWSFLPIIGWIFYINQLIEEFNQNHYRSHLLYYSVFLAFTDPVSTIIPSNIKRGCQSGTWSAGLENIRGTSTKLQREHKIERERATYIYSHKSRHTCSYSRTSCVSG